MNSDRMAISAAQRAKAGKALGTVIVPRCKGVGRFKVMMVGAWDLLMVHLGSIYSIYIYVVFLPTWIPPKINQTVWQIHQSHGSYGVETCSDAYISILVDEVQMLLKVSASHLEMI